MSTKVVQDPKRRFELKTTAYFREVRHRSDRARILDAWIELAVQQPIAEHIQTDGRIR
jgi:hypothetical protein